MVPHEGIGDHLPAGHWQLESVLVPVDTGIQQQVGFSGRLTGGELFSIGLLEDADISATGFTQ